MRAARPVWLVLVGGLLCGCLRPADDPPIPGGMYGRYAYGTPLGYYAPPPGYYAPPPGYYVPPPGYYAPPPAAPAPPSSGGAIAVAYAQTRMGLPYCRGGNGPACYDCSGLTHAAWAAAGKAIPRTSEAQAEGLPPVPMEQIQVGDVLWRPGHVGLYAGGGWVIAATKTGDVVRYQKASGYLRALRP